MLFRSLESGVLDNDDLLRDLGQLRDAGVKIGLSVTGTRQAETLRKARSIILDGKPLFGSVQATWNVLETSAGPALAEAHAAGMFVIVKEALANGLLTDRNHDPTFAAKRTVLAENAERLGTTLDALSLAAVIAQPWSDVVLSGASTMDQLASNLAAFTIPWHEETAAPLRLLAERPEDYWERRSRLAWN